MTSDELNRDLEGGNRDSLAMAGLVDGERVDRDRSEGCDTAERQRREVRALRRYVDCMATLLIDLVVSIVRRMIYVDESIKSRTVSERL